jgi:hypothetical protein
MLILLFILIIYDSLYSAEFSIQKDSYFVPLRRKVIWLYSFGFGNGAGLWLGKGSPKLDLNLEFRFLGRVKPENNFFDFFSFSLNYNYIDFENEKEINEFFIFGLCGRIGIKTIYENMPLKFVPYIGFGSGAIGEKKIYDLNTSEPKDYSNFVSNFYLINSGFEWFIFKQLSFFTELSYLYSNILHRENYLPDSDKSEATLKREWTKFRYIKILIGTHFYWE